MPPADTNAVNLALFLPTRHVSRYSLLGAMSEEVARAFTRAGATLNPEGEVHASAGLHLFLNFPDNLQSFLQWAGLSDGRPHPRSALLQFFVDHPFALDARLLDRLSAFSHYRLLLPCPDDAHLLRLRWPNLRPLHCLHGVDPSALCESATLEAGHLSPAEASGRDIDLLVAGSIHAVEDLERLKAPIPAALRSSAADMVQFLLARPLASFGQAFELCTPAGVYASAHWQCLQVMWRYVTAALNRERRTRLVLAMQGVATTVIGTEPWKEFCTGTIRYAGEAPYAELPRWFARSRTCLAWGPTQFVHGYSERLLQSLAGGCVSIADERELVKRDFSSCTLRFDAASPDQARECVEQALRDRAAALSLASTGRSAVERGHLWDHRLTTFIAALNDAMARAQARAA